MVAYNISLDQGITLGQGIGLGAEPIANGPQGSNGQILYDDMGPPIIPGSQLEDVSATINGNTGFTIKDDTATGVAVINLSSSSQTYYNNLGLGTFTATFGSGSTTSTASVHIVHLPDGVGGGGGGSALVFFILGQSGSATYNYPFYIS